VRNVPAAISNVREFMAEVVAMLTRETRSAQKAEVA